MTEAKPASAHRMGPKLIGRKWINQLASEAFGLRGLKLMFEFLAIIEKLPRSSAKENVPGNCVDAFVFGSLFETLLEALLGDQLLNGDAK